MNTRIRNSIIAILEPKAQMRQTVEKTSAQVFEELATVLEKLIDEYRGLVSDSVLLKFERPAKHVAQITVDADALVFALHTDVFQFDREHKVWEKDYVKEDPQRSFAGIINVYNLLSDSFKYDREEDMGYLVARLFINKDRSFFVEGKRQRSMGVDHFGEQPISAQYLRTFVETALKYAVEFDLLVPPYDDVKLTSLALLKQQILTSKTKTAKRMGFGFNADDVR